MSICSYLIYILYIYIFIYLIYRNTFIHLIFWYHFLTILSFFSHCSFKQLLCNRCFSADIHCQQFTGDKCTASSSLRPPFDTAAPSSRASACRFRTNDKGTSPTGEGGKMQRDAFFDNARSNYACEGGGQWNACGDSGITRELCK